MLDPVKTLAGLPVGLRSELLASYKEIAANYVEHHWEPSELNGGKFCEVVYSIINGAIAGKFPAKSTKPRDMVTACRALESTPQDSTRPGDRSLRILIPRILPPLYEIRNNRGVGHVGGDVDPNFLDATVVYSMASWVLAELVRIFHNVSTKEAQEAVDMLIERKIPLIWEIGETKRVLDPSMDSKDQALLLLHNKPGWISVAELSCWVEYSSESMFKTRVIKPLHKLRFIEYDPKKSQVHISPTGVSEVERKILKTREQ